jgi:hypothetical protein
VLASADACPAFYALFRVNDNELLPLQGSYCTGFHAAVASAFTGAAGALSVFPAALLVIYLDWHDFWE